jgi:hypothetical protein
LLRDSIQRWDFTEALNVYNEISINDTNSILVRVLNIANNILFIDEKKAKDNIKKLLKKKDLLENYKNEFEKIKNTLLKSKDNSSFLIFLKFLQVYKTGNYWAATTILVTLLEVLSQELIESYCNGITKEYEGKSYFDIKELKYKDSFMTKKSLKFNEKNKDYFLNNWPGILAVINHLNKNNITVFKGLKVIIDNIKDFKIKRNDFIHNGFGVQKKILDDFLDLDDNIKEEYFNSKLLEFIYKTLIDKNPQYFNWLEYFEEVLLEEIKNIEPNIK